MKREENSIMENENELTEFITNNIAYTIYRIAAELHRQQCKEECFCTVDVKNFLAARMKKVQFILYPYNEGVIDYTGHYWSYEKITHFFNYVSKAIKIFNERTKNLI